MFRNLKGCITYRSFKASFFMCFPLVISEVSGNIMHFGRPSSKQTCSRINVKISKRAGKEEIEGKATPMSSAQAVTKPLPESMILARNKFKQLSETNEKRRPLRGQPCKTPEEMQCRNSNNPADEPKARTHE